MEELYPNLVPPQNIEAEEAVLGSILLASDSIISVMEFFDTGRFLSCFSSINFCGND